MGLSSATNYLCDCGEDGNLSRPVPSYVNSHKSTTRIGGEIKGNIIHAEGGNMVPNT